MCYFILYNSAVGFSIVMCPELLIIFQNKSTSLYLSAIRNTNFILSNIVEQFARALYQCRYTIELFCLFPMQTYHSARQWFMQQGYSTGMHA